MAQRVCCMGTMLNGVIGRGRWPNFRGAGQMSLTGNRLASKYLVAKFCTTQTQPQTPQPPPSKNQSPQSITVENARSSRGDGGGPSSSQTGEDKFREHLNSMAAVFPRLQSRLLSTDFQRLDTVPTQLFFFTIVTSVPMMFAGAPYVGMFVVAANAFHAHNRLANDGAPATVTRLASAMAPALLCASTCLIAVPAPIPVLLVGYAASRLADDFLSHDQYPPWRDALVFLVLGTGSVGLAYDLIKAIGQIIL